MDRFINILNYINNNFFHTELKLFCYFIGFFIIAFLLSVITIVCNKCEATFWAILFAFWSIIFSILVKLSIALMVFVLLFKLIILIL